jgi:hypothetical protein
MVDMGPFSDPDGSAPDLSPTEGNYLSIQFSDLDAEEADTSSFLNYYGNPGTNGSILETAIEVDQNETFFFDWAFSTTDYSPFEDFSLVYFMDNSGDILFSDGLGQIEQVPAPASFLLLSSALAGLAGFRRYRK